MKLKLLDKLGTGSWGTVYKAVDKETGKYYAVKRFNHVSDENGIFGDIIREINVYSRMDHPNIISSPMFSIKPKRAYIVMELGDMDLDALADKRDTIKYDRLKIIYQLTCGLLYLKQCGLVHEDFSSSNVLFLGGNAKIADLDMRIGETHLPLSDTYSLATMMYNLHTNKAYETDPADDELYQETQENLKLLPKYKRDMIVGLSSGKWTLERFIKLAVFKKYKCVLAKGSIFDTAVSHRRDLHILQMRNRKQLVKWIYDVAVGKMNGKPLIDVEYQKRFFVTAVDILDRFYPDPTKKSELQLYAATAMLLAGKLLIKQPQPLLTAGTLVNLGAGAFTLDQLFETEWLIVDRSNGELYHTTIVDRTPDIDITTAKRFLVKNVSPYDEK